MSVAQTTPQHIHDTVRQRMMAGFVQALLLHETLDADALKVLTEGLIPLAGEARPSTHTSP